MKIGIDIRPIFDAPAGIGRYAKNIVERLLASNSNDEFILFCAHSKNDSLFTNARIEKIESNFLLWHFWVAQRIKREKIDVYISFASVIVLLMTRVRSLILVPDLTPIHMPNFHSIKSIISYRFLMGKAIQKAHKVFTLSQNSKRDILSKFHVGEEKVKVIYPGVSDIKKNGGPPLPFTINNVGIKKPYLLYVGTVEPRKDIGLLIKAFAHLKKEKDFTGNLLIAGRLGWKYEDLFKTEEYTENKESIHFLGFVTDKELSFLYQQAEVFVYPSLYEGFGLPILEAMQFDIPVITSASSSLREAGGDGVLYFEPGNAEELCFHLKTLLKNPEKREDLIKRNRKHLLKFQYSYSALELKKLIGDSA